MDHVPRLVDGDVGRVELPVAPQVDPAEPTAGLEPTTYGLRSGTGPTSAAPEQSQHFTFHTVADSAASPNVPTDPANHGQFAALVLQRSGRLVSPKDRRSAWVSSAPPSTASARRASFRTCASALCCAST